MGVLSHKSKSAKASGGRETIKQASGGLATHHSSIIIPSSRFFPHMTILVLLAAAAGTRIVAADALAAVANRFRFLIGLLAAGNGGVLLAANTLAVSRSRRRTGRGFVNRGPHLPDPFLKS